MTEQPVHDAGTSEPALRVGYVLKMFPRLSETFILNELLELERQGVEAAVFSLMHPDDGRFHARLSELRLTAEYLPKDKLERYWDLVWSSPPEFVPSIERWGEAVGFLRRHAIPGDLDLLLRALVIATRVKRGGIRHVHAHFATVATRVAALVSLFADVPFSFTAHAKDIFRETVDRTLFAELVDRAAFVITVSDFNRDYILSNTPGVDPRKIIRLYNGIDLEFFKPREGGAPPDVPHILSVGRLVPKKGFDHLLRSLEICKRSGMAFRATIVGDGERRAALESLRDELGLTDEVVLTGALPQEEVRDLVAGATMIALACVPDADGNMDALPTVLLEGLAFDTPIVSTRLTGIPEIVGEEAGLLVDPGDDPGMAAALASMWERVRSGGQVPGKARARAVRLFDLRTNAGTLRSFFARSAVGETVSEAV